jgi:hypothetical protein
MRGWTKLDRNIIFDPIVYQATHSTLTVWLYFLTQARFKAWKQDMPDGTTKELPSGSLLVTRRVVCNALRISVGQYRHAVEYLTKKGFCRIEGNNQFSIVYLDKERACLDSASEEIHATDTQEDTRAADATPYGAMICMESAYPEVHARDTRCDTRCDTRRDLRGKRESLLLRPVMPVTSKAPSIGRDDNTTREATRAYARVTTTIRDGETVTEYE